MQRILGLFSTDQSAVTPSPLLTRFQTTIELKGYAAELTKLRIKAEQMTATANAEGAQSKEYLIAQLLNQLVATADNEIQKFNLLAKPVDHYVEVQEILQLIQNLIDPALKSTDANERVLNGARQDTHFLRNGALAVGVLAIPVAPFAIFGFGVTAALGGLAGLLIINPVVEALKSIKALDLDTNSKTIVDGYAKTIHDLNHNLSAHLKADDEYHNQRMEKSAISTPALK